MCRQDHIGSPYRVFHVGVFVGVSETILPKHSMTLSLVTFRHTARGTNPAALDGIYRTISI